MERFNRAVRRHHVARLKKKRKSYWGYGRTTEVASVRQLGILVHTPQVCSCIGCGNQRTWYGDKVKDVYQPKLEKEIHHE